MDHFGERPAALSPPKISWVRHRGGQRSAPGGWGGAERGTVVARPAVGNGDLPGGAKLEQMILPLNLRPIV